MNGGLVLTGLIVLVAIWIIGTAVRVVQEYERGVIFRLGRLAGARGPGLFFIIPILDRIVKIDLRVVTLEIPPQEIITRDNVTMRVSAVLYFRVMDPERAVIRVADYYRARCQGCGATARQSGTEAGAINEWNEAIDADRARLLAERGGAP